MDKNAPFQTYDDRSDAATCAPRLAALRGELAKRGLDGFVVPHSDEYQSEYLPARNERLAWLTAFTGSAGAAVVLRDRAAVFVDGRYTLQVQQQTDTKLFEPRDLVAEGPAAWIEANAPKGAKIGYDPWVHTASGVDALRLAATKAGAELIACATNPIDAVWTDQPQAPLAKAMPHDISLAGESAESKRMRIAEDVKSTGADAAVVTLSDSICWLLNMRGGDTPHTPFVLSYAILNSDGSTDLFMDERKSSPELTKHFGNAVRVREPGEFTSALDALTGKTVLADPTTAPAAIFERLNKAGATVKRGSDPCQLPKACKNPVEIEGTRKAHMRDGAALTRFLAWIAREAPGGHLTEIEASQTLEGYRRETGALTDLCFDSISGAAPHAALAHYRVTQSTNRNIHRDEIYPDRFRRAISRWDDGCDAHDDRGQADRGDERPLHPRAEGPHFARHREFPDGTTGAALDAFARQSAVGCGTRLRSRHGPWRGHYLSVHEGPQNISKRPVLQPFAARHDLLQRAWLLQGGRIRHPHREPDRGDGWQGHSGRRTADDGIRDHHASRRSILNLVEPSLLTADEKRVAQRLSRQGAREAFAASG